MRVGDQGNPNSKVHFLYLAEVEHTLEPIDICCSGTNAKLTEASSLLVSNNYKWVAKS